MCCSAGGWHPRDEKQHGFGLPELQGNGKEAGDQTNYVMLEIQRWRRKRQVIRQITQILLSENIGSGVARGVEQHRLPPSGSSPLPSTLTRGWVDALLSGRPGLALKWTVRNGWRMR